MCTCGSSNILSINAKCADRCVTTFSTDDGEQMQSVGYVPRRIGIGGGDNVKLEICADCGQVQGWDKLEFDAYMNEAEKA